MKAECIMDLCRICVERSEDYIRIYDKVVPDNTPFFYVINEVCQLDISENDGFPEYICKDCFLKISEFMIFKRKSHESKLNFLSMKITLSEDTPLRDAGLDKEAVVATSIIVKEMSSESETLDVAQPGDIIEELITMPFVVDYEEVVTDDTYTVSVEPMFVEKAAEEEASPLADQKRNSKEREVAIMLADGGNALPCKEEGKNVTVVQDTGQEGRANEVHEEDEERVASQQRSFVAQAYYRSYLLEKERRGGERSSALEESARGGGATDPSHGSPVGAMGAPPDTALGEGAVGKEGSREVDLEVSPATEEEGKTPKVAVCCKKKMLAISKSLALSRGLELSEKAGKSESMRVESDLDVLVEACRSRDGSGMAPKGDERTPVASVEVSGTGASLEAGGAVVAEGGAVGSGGKTEGVSEVRQRQDSGDKGSLKASGKGDRRGNAQGPRFKMPESEPAPPKLKKKEVPVIGDPKQGIKFIQVIASEELRSKRQQLGDLEQQMGDILKTSLLGKKTIQVSEVGPSGKVFHVEPTIVKLTGIPMVTSRHGARLHGTMEPIKSGAMNALRGEGDHERERGGQSVVVSEGGQGWRGEKPKALGGEVPLPSGTIAMETNPISILGSDDGSPKTLLLTAPKEENASTPALAILLRPLKQEDEEMADDHSLLEISGMRSNSLQLLADSAEAREDNGGGMGGEAPLGDSETFCNQIRLRAKKALLGCIKKTLDELERLQGEEQQDLVVVPEEEPAEVNNEEREEEETVYECVYCGQSSYSKAEMGWHMKEAHCSNKQRQSEYYCTKCDSCFTKRYVYRLHMEMHDMLRQEGREHEEEEEVETGEEGGGGGKPNDAPASPLKCHYCDLQFSGKPALLFHEASKHQASPLFPCGLCSKKFLTEEKRASHQKLCSGNRLECELCHKEYNVGSITQHMRTHRGEKPYLCAECGKTFSQKGDLKRHTRQIHLGLEPIKPFLCSYCPKTFSAQSKLRIHERSHTKEKPFVCDECGKGFAHLSTLRKHRENREFACLPVIEQATKPYTCAICKKGWDHKYALTKHIAWVHERKRPSRTFPCPYCSKVYYCRSQLTYHERTHTKEKPFVCGICDKNFMYNSVRKAHMAKEHGLKRSICDGPQ